MRQGVTVNTEKARGGVERREQTGRRPDSPFPAERRHARSRTDRPLSDRAAFTTTTLAAGTHEISLRVQDDDGAWSRESRASLRVDPAAGGTATAGDSRKLSSLWF